MKHIKELQQLLSQYFSLSFNNLVCLSSFMVASFIVYSVNFSKISKAIPSNAKHASVYKRMQRFIKRLNFSPAQHFAMVIDVFKLTRKLTLCMDRTNWKFGKVDIYFLVIGIAHKGISIPL